MNRLLKFPAKLLRARVISQYAFEAGYPGVVVFTCGNSADAFRSVNVQAIINGKFKIVEVGPNGTLNPNKWFTPAEVHALWPALLDATSGHLTIPLMFDIAKAFQYYLGNNIQGGDVIEVPTGSGETIICLSLAYPFTRFIAVYDSEFEPTIRDLHSPLNFLVDKYFEVVHRPGTLEKALKETLGL